LTLYDTIELPSLDFDPTETVLPTGFVHLIKLFKPFNKTSIGLWKQPLHGAMPWWMNPLQQEIDDALPNYLEGIDTTLVDLEMSQQWIRVMILKLAIGQSFVSGMDVNDTWNLRLPVNLAFRLEIVSTLC